MGETARGRDWAAWLFLLFAAGAILLVLYLADARPGGLQPGIHHAKAPPANIIPAVLPVELAPVTTADAERQNAQIPFVTTHPVAARPFQFSGSDGDRVRARDCLATAMLYEAGDDAKGERAVAQVVINRARHPAFPKSICGVVFQGSDRVTGCQFSFTCDGALQRRYADAAWQRARAIADQMLAGSVDTSVGLATHYHTDWVRPYWSDSLEKIAAVDTHLFFRWPGFWGTPAAFRSGIGGVEPAITKMAPLSAAHASALPVSLTTNPTATVVGEPRLISGAGAAIGRDSIYIVLDRQASPDGFVMLALRLCGQRDYCKLMGWTNPLFKPDGDLISDTARSAMSFSYLRDEKQGFEKAMWNCSEFKRDDIRQCMKRTASGVRPRPVRAGSDISPPSASPDNS